MIKQIALLIHCFAFLIQKQKRLFA